MAATPEALSESLDQLYSTTWQLMRKEAVDNIFNATPLSYRLYNKGIRKESGGRWIGVQLLYGKNTTVKTIGIGGAVDIVNDELITTGKADWKWVVANIVRYFGEDTQNAGKEQIMNLLQAKLKVAELSLVDKFEEMLVADGSGNGGLDWCGLAKYITVAGTGDSLGIDATTNTWWNNKTTDMAQGGSTTHLGTMNLIRNTYNDCSVGNDHPTILMSTQEMYEWYELQLQNILRVAPVDRKMADLGFEALQYKGADWTYSPSLVAGSFDTSDHGLFFLNERYLDLVIHTAADFHMTEWKPIPNQLDRVAQIVVQGELVCSNRRMQGIGYGIAAIPVT